ncbi:MAG: DCC1-like thiol-disulfide oxidoreductase family protein [Corynebacterium sp.]|uniref:DCC1-like thiol-disulfide oxidoreductase family protein n=1 Tax=Corynebacterium sp. TaxID=1720 RepID=UPI0026DBE1DF|nr:DCC1-like thiol-disulfide oxidoreductase family protein [Corynebacterium sp.]MDO5099062.1 DCC1-like thiol-disulfide oxidoreductase family protein [Corynebacterium sp.]
MKPIDVVYYDADCGFCQRAALWLNTLTARSIPSRPAHPDHLDCDSDVRREIATHVVAYCGGTMFVAHHAIGQVLRTHGRNGLVRLAGNALLIPVLSPVWARIYYFIAKHRSAISARIGAPQCTISDSQTHIGTKH